MNLTGKAATMSEVNEVDDEAGAKEVQARYICLDIEGYTKDREVRAQLKIRAVLDDIVRECVGLEPVLADKRKRMYLPTGDGMCIALLDIPSPTDPIHLRLALRILKSLREYNGRAEYRELQFDVRIGIHAAVDYIVKDINESDNLAGAGINTAFRIMSIGDGGEILVSEEVFLDLFKQFPQQFKRHEVKVRHGVPLPVYQFRGEAEGLIKNVPLTVQEQERYQRVQEAVVKPSIDLGLTHVYESRNKEAVRTLREDIEGARRRIWLLGIALSDNFDIADPEVIRLLSRKVDEHVDVSILLLDGFRSPALFRALLECDAETAHEIISAERRGLNLEEPYLETRVFKNFERVYNALAKEPNFETAVRFYGHTPICWLAIVDDTAYYQPYTFGDISADPEVRLKMPVTKLKRRTTTFRILEDHFNRLWVTSDTDLFLMGTRLKAKEKTFWKTFTKRRDEDEGKWLKHLDGIASNGWVERRPHLRQPCLTINLLATITWLETGEETKAKVLDYSLEGTLLELVKLDAESEPFLSLPEHHSQSDKEILALLEIEPEGGWKKFERQHGKDRAEALKHALSATYKTDNEFRYIRKEAPEGRKPRVVLQARRVKKP